VKFLVLLVAAAAIALAGFATTASAQTGICAPGTAEPNYCPDEKVAPGQYCKGQSKKKQPGQKKTPFAQCVSAVAKAQRSLRTTPRQACRTLSKKKARGQKAKGTPFSICVKGAARAQRDIRAAS